MASTISRGGGITIPAGVLREAGLAPGDEVSIRAAGAGRVEVQRAGARDEFAGVLDGQIHPPHPVQGKRRRQH